MTDEEESAVVDWGQSRFEFNYVNFPNPFDRGDFVCVMDDPDRIGLVETTQLEWCAFLKRIHEKSLPVAYSDASIAVEFLLPNGRFSHSRHVAPILLEKVELHERDERFPLFDAARRLICGEGGLDEFLYQYDRYRNNLEELAI